MPGFAPDCGPGEERDDGAGLGQGQSDDPLYPWRPGCPEAGGQSPPRSVHHLGAGTKGAAGSLRDQVGGAGRTSSRESAGSEGESCSSAVGAPLTGPGAQLQRAAEQRHAAAAALAQPPGH